MAQEAMKPLDNERLDAIRDEFGQNPINRIAMNAVVESGIDAVARNASRARTLSRRFSVTVDNGKVTNQRRSGRCWLFSSLNVARNIAKKNLGIKEFEFSQSYAMFFDKLERVNYFIRDVADLVVAGESEDSRLMQHLLHDVMGDGGQWTMAMNIYQKYGAVPKDVFPESASSKATATMNTNLRTMLHRAVARLYAGEDAQQVIDDCVSSAYRMLCIHLGEPPRSFDWEYTDDEGNFHREGEMTPQEFWNEYVGSVLDEYVCLVDDPRADHPKGRRIAIEHLGNVVDGAETAYLNVPIEFMKQCARKILSEQHIPVWFGADCHPMMDRKEGAWATDLFEYNRVYSVDFDMDKETRVRFADSQMNHAMVFVGVDVADDGETTRRWRVENSWGDEIADKGYFTMDDAWFDEFVYEVAVPKSMLPAEYAQALEEPAIVLPAWDPMGALA